MFTGFHNFFSDLLIEVYQDELALPSMSIPANAATSLEKSEKRIGEGNALDSKQPSLIIKSHKLVVSNYSRYLYTMLTSKMREGRESTIRLVTVYPQSLQKLLLSFYEHVLEIGSAEELIELLYLADEFDVPNVTATLLQFLTAALNRGSSAQSISLEIITLESAPMFLHCSSKLNLKLELDIFSRLSKQWWLFGPLRGRPHAFEEHMRNCSILLQSLDFHD
jgi:hypothetical protein